MEEVGGNDDEVSAVERRMRARKARESNEGGVRVLRSLTEGNRGTREPERRKTVGGRRWMYSVRCTVQ